MADRTPPYARIAAGLRSRILAGELQPGERVPSTRELTREWGVALATATRALAELRREGLVVAMPRVGTVVANLQPSPAPAPPDPVPAPAVLRSARRTTTGAVTVEEVVRAAIGIADADGLDALSMRTVATRLQVPTMSLYRQVSGKGDLVLKMIDTAFGAASLPDRTSDGWRAGLEAVARAQWAVYRRHPWLAHAVALTRPQPVASLIRVGDRTLRVMDGLGLDQQTLLDVNMSLATYVRGVAIGLAAEAELEADTGLTGDEWVEVAAPIHELLASGGYPDLRRVSSLGNYELNLDRLFEFGLQRWLDGLDVFLQRARS
jgi:DNA-binding transcriptional regulator YhcF (GntR family)